MPSFCVIPPVIGPPWYSIPYAIVGQP